MPLPIRAGGLAALLALAALGAAQAQTPAPAATVVAANPCNAPVNRNEPDPFEALGCASQTNLRAMIADPADLDHGVHPTPPSGDAAFAAAQRHRLGQPKKLVDVDSSGSGGGAGVPQQNTSSR